MTNVAVCQNGAVPNSDTLLRVSPLPSKSYLHTHLRQRLKSRVLRNLLSNGSANLAVALLQMLTLAVFARVLPASTLADYILAVATVAIVEVVSDFGTRHWAIRELSKHYSAKRFEQAVALKSGFSALTLIVGGAAALFFIEPLSSIVMMMLIGITQSSSDPILWRLRAAQDMQREAKIVVASRSFTSVAIIIVGFVSLSINAILSVWLLCNLMRYGYELVVFWRSTPPAEITTHRHLRDTPDVKRLELSAIFKTTCWIGLSASVYTLYYRMGVLHLEHTSADVVIATFGLFFSLASASTIVSNTLANVLYPKVSQAVHSSDTEQVTKELQRLFWLFGAIFLSGGIIGVFVHQWIVQLYAGENYADSQLLLQLIPWIYLTGLASCLRMVLLAMSHERYELLVNITALGFFVFITVYLPNYIEPIHRIILGYTCSEFLMCFLRIVCLQKHKVRPTSLWAVLSGAGLLTALVLL